MKSLERLMGIEPTWLRLNGGLYDEVFGAADGNRTHVAP